MKAIAVGNIPNHQYIWIDSQFTHKDPIGFIPAVWFAMNSVVGRTWGIHVMLESGAFFRNLPPQAISFTHNPQESNWTAQDAQKWDCYSQNWTSIQYEYLSGLTCKAVIDDNRTLMGSYLFSVCPLDDGFTAYPEQAKEFMFIALDNGRLTIQPTNRVVFQDKSFTVNPDMSIPKGLKVSKEIYSVE
jgi:hypothetical protein